MALDLSGPALLPPTGAVQNLDNPPNHNDGFVAGYTVCIFVTSVFVSLRLYAKFIFLKLPRVVDYLLFPLFGIYIAHCVFWLRMNGTTGNMVHMWNFRLGGLAPFYRNGFYGSVLYETVMMTIKPMILFEWTSIFAPSGLRNWFKWVAYTVSTINVLMYFIAIMIDSTSCHPRAAWWDLTIEGGHCINTKKLPIVTSTMNAIIDLIILLLPQNVIWRLHLSKGRKIGISLVFFVGVISVVAAVSRTVLGYTYENSDDVTYNFSRAGIFMLLEMTSAILVFTIPTTPKPMAHLAQQAGSSINRLMRSTGNGGSSGDGAFATGIAGPKADVYHNNGEPENSMPLTKIRPTKSQRAGGGVERDAESELELVMPEHLR
ncbi:hypothetical protein EJ04DRAFT_448516 [Polyplosphaeria fusca]|uniref:Rhodopsin domain-containing protein n=1 Tax=Polyplosphaeria fusca TaxID=682080 RepID=A0A9P4UXC6_9PLEO|nr:hypothetical protein EJ04DRAFT_448516 [Polyplosphaeria fusca]